MGKKFISIFKTARARKLIQQGFIVKDIKPDKYEPKKERSIFVFENTEELQEALSGNALETAKKELCNNFGDRLEIKEWYVSEVKQKKQYYAVAQLVVVYENISVTYTFSFDTDMKLVGFYMDKCD